MENKLKKTILYDWHSKEGANMASFGEYTMPLWYPEGVLKEHMAIVQGAGIFDTSHMAVLMVSGTQSRRVLQFCFSNDLEACTGVKKKPLEPGRCVYGAFLDKDASVIDDAIIYCCGGDHYMICVNSGMGAAIKTHIEQHSNDMDIKIEDLTDMVGKMDIQGPLSAKILEGILKDPESVFTGFPYFSFKGSLGNLPAQSSVNLKDGTPILLSRTGYTGEFGFEIFTAPENFQNLWEMIYEKGKGFNIQPCGLAARDSLRSGAVLPLSHQDIGNWPYINHPWSFALPLDQDGKTFTKDFLGKEALISHKASETTLPFAGYNPRKVSGSEKSIVVDPEGTTIGTVLTCTTDMAIGRIDNQIVSVASPEKPDNFSPKGLSCGFLRVNKELSPGQVVELREGKRKIKVEIVKDIRPDRTARKPMVSMI